MINRKENEVTGYLVFAALALFGAIAIPFMLPSSSTAASVIASISGQSTFRSHADRIAQIRGGGSAEDGVHMLRMPIKISDADGDFNEKSVLRS